jgi:Trk K+ transport system NAD-binding subunit
MPKTHLAIQAPAQRYPIWRLIRANLYDLGLLLRESWVVLSGFLVLAVVGTLYLHYRTIQPLGFVEALYETLKLLTLQSGLDLPGDRLGQALFFVLPLLGLALIFQSVLNFGRLLLDKGSRREAWQVALAATYRDHVIICGLGRVSLRVLLQLRDAGYEALAIESDWNSEFVERALAMKVPVVLGDAREPAILRQAGIARARALLTGVNDDLLNIEIALTARAVRPDLRVILRVFNDELDRNLERNFGSNSAFSASALAAPTFAAAAVSRAIDVVVPSGEALLGVVQLTVEPGSSLCDTVAALEHAHAIRVLQPNPGETPPHPSRPLAGGDQIIAIGSIATLETLRLKNAPRASLPLQHPTEQLDTVIVCGLGKVGYRVVRRLCAMQPRPRVVVVRTASTSDELARRVAQLGGVRTMVGDARDPDVLRQAGIESAYALAALTSDDGLNLQIGLAAQRQRPDMHLVLRVFSDALAEKLGDMFGIRTAYSTSGLAAPTLAAAAVLGNVDQAFSLGAHLFAAVQLSVRDGDALAGRSVEALRARHNALAIGVQRGAEAHTLPALDCVFAPGDLVTLLAPLPALARLRATQR